MSCRPRNSGVPENAACHNDSNLHVSPKYSSSACLLKDIWTPLRTPKSQAGCITAIIQILLYTIEILADGSVLATIIADGFREDLLRAGKGNGNHAFRFSMPPGQSAKSRLRARVTGQPWFIQLCTEAYSRAFAFMLHTCEYGIPEPPFGFAEVPEPDPKTDIPLANRLIAAYHRASRADVKRNKQEDQWTLLERSIFPDFIDILQRKDAHAFADYMRSFFARSISHGTFQGTEATKGLKDPGSAASVAGRTLDALASACEAMGLLRVENPEQGHYGENLFREPDELIDLLESFLKIDAIPPNAAGKKFGIRTRKGILALTDVRALYAARRIQEIIGPVRSPSVCEIGGGIGGVAYNCQLLGIKNYTIIDLPAIPVMQGYWLTRALPNAADHSLRRARSGWAGNSFIASFPFRKIQSQSRV